MRALALALLLALCTVVHAQDLSKPVVLVASPALQDAFYGGTVIIVVPLGGDQHVGFIINKPTDMPLARVFPDDGPSQKVEQPLYIGGPAQSQLIFALVQRTSSPDGKSLCLMPGVYASIHADTVEAIIEADAAHARFVAGFVAWHEGELAAEVKAHAWYVLPPEERVLDAPASGLWKTLVDRALTEVI
jgi:putative AlgH/UPF0301 family transcriptional regulator